MRLSLIVARTTRGVIGCNGKIPWDVPEDRYVFRELTMGHALIMGRKTFQSLPGPLKGRKLVVLSRTMGRPADWPSCNRVVWSPAEALVEAFQQHDHVFIAGGVHVYRTFINVCDSAYISTIRDDVVADDSSNFAVFDYPFASSEWEQGGPTYSFRESRAVYHFYHRKGMTK